MKVKRALKELAEFEKREALTKDEDFGRVVAAEEPKIRVKKTRFAFIIGACVLILVIGVIGLVVAVTGEGKFASVSMIDVSKDEAIANYGASQSLYDKSLADESATVYLICDDVAVASEKLAESEYFGTIIIPCLQALYLIDVNSENRATIDAVLKDIGVLIFDEQPYELPIGKTVVRLKNDNQ